MVTLSGADTSRGSSSKCPAAQEGSPGLCHAYIGALDGAMPGIWTDFRPWILEGQCPVGDCDF